MLNKRGKESILKCYVLPVTLMLTGIKIMHFTTIEVNVGISKSEKWINKCIQNKHEPETQKERDKHGKIKTV